MKNSLTFILLVFSHLFAQSQSISWVNGSGGSTYDGAYDVVSDNAGGALLTGEFSGTMTIGGQTYASAGGADIFISAYDASGNISWVITAGGPGEDVGHQVAKGPNNEYIVAGEFENVITIGNTTLTSQGMQDIFIAKVNGNGNVLWASSAGGSGQDEINSLHVTSTGDIYITGAFEGAAGFGPAAVTSAGGKDIFVSRINSNGTYFWTSRAGGPMDDIGRGVAVNISNEVLVTGYYQGTAQFGPNQFTSNNNSRDIFASFFGSSGQFLFTISSGGPENDGAYEATADAAGDFYVTGNFKGTVPFPVGILNSQGDDDVFVYKIDPSGTFLWAQSAGGPGKDKAYSISVDNASNLFVAGSFEGTADFDGQTVTSAGGEDIFMAAYTGSGNLNLVRSAGGPQFDRAYGLHKEFGHAYVCGVFSETAQFESLSLTAAGNNDALVFKFEDPVGMDEYGPGEPLIYPNPFSHAFYIAADSDRMKDSSVEMYDLNGRMVFSQYFSGNTTIEPGDITPGIYELRVRTGDHFDRMKIICTAD
jgi:hypothetical protein